MAQLTRRQADIVKKLQNGYRLIYLGEIPYIATRDSERNITSERLHVYTPSNLVARGMISFNPLSETFCLTQAGVAYN